jgi:hypothetical protein
MGKNIGDELLISALQMAGVFMTATSALLRRTGATPRWIGVSGGIVSLLLIFSIYVTKWIGLLFPLWILVLGIDTLLVTSRKPERLEG